MILCEEKRMYKMHIEPTWVLNRKKERFWKRAKKKCRDASAVSSSANTMTPGSLPPFHPWNFRQECWEWGKPFSSPWDLPNPGSPNLLLCCRQISLLPEYLRCWWGQQSWQQQTSHIAFTDSEATRWDLLHPLRSWASFFEPPPPSTEHSLDEVSA